MTWVLNQKSSEMSLFVLHDSPRCVPREAMLGSFPSGIIAVLIIFFKSAFRRGHRLPNSRNLRKKEVYLCRSTSPTVYQYTRAHIGQTGSLSIIDVSQGKYVAGLARVPYPNGMKRNQPM